MAQIVLQHRGDVGLVLDDEDAGHVEATTGNDTVIRSPVLPLTDEERRLKAPRPVNPSSLLMADSS